MRALSLVLITLAACKFQANPGMGDDMHVADASGVDGPGDSAGDALDDASADSNGDADTCPAGFANVAGAPGTSRYRVFAGATFNTAVSTCMGLGTHLTRLDTQAEADAIYTLIDSATGAGDSHIYRVIGTRHANGAGSADDTWHDLDGSVLAFQPWGIGEPTNGAGEDCMSLRLENSGNPPPKVVGADVCTTAHEFACECE